MIDFKNKSELIYDYEHKALTISIIVSENHNIALSGGHDKKVVLHDLNTGKTIKKFSFDNQSIYGFLLLESIVAVGNKKDISFINLANRKKTQLEKIKFSESYIFGLQTNLDKVKANHFEQKFLFVGKSGSNKLEQFFFPFEGIDQSKFSFNF